MFEDDKFEQQSLVPDENSDVEKDAKFGQQNLVPDENGDVSINVEQEQPTTEGKSSYPPLRVEKGNWKVEKKEENLVSFKKGAEIHAFSRGLRRYTPFTLKNNVNAYFVEAYKSDAKWRCYCFEENLDEQTNRAKLVSRGYKEYLDGYFPYFFAHKYQERKAKKSNRLIQPE